MSKYGHQCRSCYNLNPTSDHIFKRIVLLLVQKYSPLVAKSTLAVYIFQGFKLKNSGIVNTASDSNINQSRLSQTKLTTQSIKIHQNQTEPNLSQPKPQSISTQHIISLPNSTHPNTNKPTLISPSSSKTKQNKHSC